MRHLTITECHVRPGQMQEFLTSVQKWEQDAMAQPSAPSFHGVYLKSDDPARVLVVTQFADAADAEAFAATGLLDGFRDQILSCTIDGPGGTGGYDLFYATGTDGPHVVFGEDA